MSDVDALVAWLRAQWDADEKAARAWPEDCRTWQTVGLRRITWQNGVSQDISAIDVSGGPALWDERILVVDTLDQRDDHIARHDPADTLARIQAERTILSGYERTAREVEDAGLDIYDREGNRRCGALAALENALYALAWGYRHRAGWHDGWAP